MLPSINLTLSNCPMHLRVYLTHSYDPNGWVTQSLYVCIVINSLSSIVAVFLNGLVITAILKTKNLQTPSFFLLCGLSFVDLLVGIFTQPRLVALHILELMGAINALCRFSSATVFYGEIIIALSMATAISLDRYRALHLGIRYSTVVTRRKTLVVIAIIWILGFLSGGVLPQFKIGLYGILLMALLPPLLVASTVCYIKFLRALKHRRNQVAINNTPEQPSQSNAANSAIHLLKYVDKVSKTVVWVVGLLLLCFAPTVVIILLIPIFKLRTIGFLTNYTSTLMYLKSTLNPVLYLIRMRGIRRSCLRLLRKCCSCVKTVEQPVALKRACCIKYQRPTVEQPVTLTRFCIKDQLQTFEEPIILARASVKDQEQSIDQTVTLTGTCTNS